MRSRLRSSLALASTLVSLSLTLGACSDEGGSAQSSGDITEESCSATFRVLQKDAYKETAGRTSELWPPHTTTVLDLECDDELVRSSFEANHGTEPGQRDANGDVILVEVASYSAPGTRAELGALLDAYEACDCDGDTEFLSLDTLQDETAAALLETVAGYLQANLVCEGDGTSEILGALQTGDVTTALTILPSCAWADGGSFEEGLNAAFAELLVATNELLADYHVCNNDAVVQKALFDGFAESGAIACSTGDLCRGPKWLYTPEPAGSNAAD
jgi:hypothetical protein